MERSNPLGVYTVKVEMWVQRLKVGTFGRGKKRYRGTKR